MTRQARREGEKMNAIEIRNLTKNFGHKQALQGLNMTVPAGSIYGFIGENGSKNPQRKS